MVFVSAWWDYTHSGSKSLGSTLMAQHNYPVEHARLCWNTSYRSAPLKAQTHENAIYVLSVMNRLTGDEWDM
jgi:hypothetical protein